MSLFFGHFKKYGLNGHSIPQINAQDFSDLIFEAHHAYYNTLFFWFKDLLKEKMRRAGGDIF